jgi:hypothetical protein
MTSTTLLSVVPLAARLPGLVANPGWKFLTAEPADVERVRRGLGFVSDIPDEDADPAYSVGLLRYGSEPEMRWAHCQSQAAPRVIAHSMLRLRHRRGQPRRGADLGLPAARGRGPLRRHDGEAADVRRRVPPPTTRPWRCSIAVDRARCNRDRRASWRARG